MFAVGRSVLVIFDELFVFIETIMFHQLAGSKEGWQQPDHHDH
jgi:hypothetical protein